MRYVALVGRILFSAIFIIAGLAHFTQAEIGYAAQQGVPFASVLVPASGMMAVAGGVSILVGYHARIGAVLLAVFLVPVTLTLHRFWAETDPMMAQLQLAMFLKNVSMLGGALIVSHFGPGPVSIDAWLRRPGAAGARRPHAA
jgi:putative oxidoreductase